jgi:hypothetical protein
MLVLLLECVLSKVPTILDSRDVGGEPVRPVMRRGIDAGHLLAVRIQ